MDHILEITNLSKSYKDFSLENINISLPYGKILGLVGENGAGKTTIIKLILNGLKREHGTITVFGMDNIKDEISIKKQMGVCLDQCYFDENLNIKEVNSIMHSIYKEWSRDYFFQLLRELGISEEKRIKHYSKGMKAKLNIAVTLASSPQLLLLDEPTAGLDPIVRDDILRVYSDYVHQTNSSILFSSHITSDIEKIADTIFFIHEGRIVLSMNKEDMNRIYGEVLCERNDFYLKNKQGVIAILHQDNGIHLLVDRTRFVGSKPGYFVTPVNVEKILLYIVKGEGIGDAYVGTY